MTTYDDIETRYASRSFTSLDAAQPEITADLQQLLAKRGAEVPAHTLLKIARLLEADQFDLDLEARLAGTRSQVLRMINAAATQAHKLGLENALDPAELALKVPDGLLSAAISTLRPERIAGPREDDTKVFLMIPESQTGDGLHVTYKGSDDDSTRLEVTRVILTDRVKNLPLDTVYGDLEFLT